MSKYTTEVRYVCEQISGFGTGSFADVDAILDAAWSKIFTTKVKIFDEAYRQVICKKILKHYYFNEIGFETVGMWKLYLNMRLEELLPYYNQLYESELIKFDPLQDVDLTTKHNRELEGSDSRQGTTGSSKHGSHSENADERINTSADDQRRVDGDNNETRHDSGSNSSSNESSVHDIGKDVDAGNKATESDSMDMYADTPQDGVTQLLEGKYLTNARKIDQTGTDTESRTVDHDVTSTGNGSASGSNESDGTTKRDYGETNIGTSSTASNKVNIVNGGNEETMSGESSESGNMSSTEDYLETIVGKRGGVTYSAMIKEFRDTFLNIDLEIIQKFSDLFMLLW